MFRKYEFDLSNITMGDVLYAFEQPLNTLNLMSFLDRVTIGGIKNEPLEALPFIIQEFCMWYAETINDYNRENQ